MTAHGLRWLADSSALGCIGKGELLFYGWPALDAREQAAFNYPCALHLLPASPLAAIGSWEAGMLIDLTLHKDAA